MGFDLSKLVLVLSKLYFGRVLALLVAKSARNVFARNLALPLNVLRFILLSLYFLKLVLSSLTTQERLASRVKNVVSLKIAV